MKKIRTAQVQVKFPGSYVFQLVFFLVSIDAVELKQKLLCNGGNSD